MGIIYAIRCHASGKLYIGQTRLTLEKRWKGHLADARRGSPLPIHAAIRKYGSEAFTQEMVWEGESSFLNVEEILCIKLVEARNPKHGYNLAPGGNYVHAEHLTPAHRKAISLSCLGLQRSQATKDRMKISRQKLWNDPTYRTKVLKGITQPHKKNRPD